MFEYAISDGEGTLIDYGVADAIETIGADLWVDWARCWGGPAITESAGAASIIFAPCADDCQTGK